MGSDKQFTATGKAIVGFQTDGARIERGAEIAGNVLGVRGTGPIGVVGEGATDGVHGKGSSGRGGRFASGQLHAQVKLEPQTMKVLDKESAAKPEEITDPQLPKVGELGDLWMTQISAGGLGTSGKTPAALWLCVVTGGHAGERPALWSQVLLGLSHAGTQ